MAFADQMMLAATGGQRRKPPDEADRYFEQMRQRRGVPPAAPAPAPPGPDEADQYFQQKRQRGYAEGDIIPGREPAEERPNLERLRRQMTPLDRETIEDMSQKPKHPMPGEYLPLPGEELTLADIIGRFAARPR